jgi:3-oxoacyl-[acyl-carrier-protein] synthase-1
MESVAIARAGLENVPVNGLKGYFGHTLGAAGVLECVISAYALADNTVLPTLGFRTKDTDSRLQLSDRINRTDKPYFIKTLSGFGGCNAALLFYLPPQSPEKENNASQRYRCASRALLPLYIRAHCCIANGCASLNGQPVRVETDAENEKFLTALYRSLKTDYPKFFKMDHLSKLGFLASELIFGGNASRFTQPKEMAVVCFNRTASLDTDSAYQATIQYADDYIPSPSVFVYTLPNIVTAEIAIRNKVHGETSFYVSEFFDSERLVATVNSVFRSKGVAYALAAWVEYAETGYETRMFLVSAIPQQMPFNADTVNRLYNKPI